MTTTTTSVQHTLSSNSKESRVTVREYARWRGRSFTFVERPWSETRPVYRRAGFCTIFFHARGNASLARDRFQTVERDSAGVYIDVPADLTEFLSTKRSSAIDSHNPFSVSLRVCWRVLDECSRPFRRLRFPILEEALGARVTWLAANVLATCWVSRRFAHSLAAITARGATRAWRSG